MLEKSCGTIPYTIKNGTVCYLLVKAKDDGYCGFPKGHVEKNESEEETALRETLEETSIHTQINSAFRYEISYQMGNGNTKTVVYFLAKFQNQTPKRNKDFEDLAKLINRKPMYLRNHVMPILLAANMIQMLYPKNHPNQLYKVKD